MEIGPGKDAPKKVNAIIEIPKGSSIKYEMDEETGLIKVDRILHTAMFYPYNYGFIPGTRSADGDPSDIMVISTASFAPGTLVQARPIGLLMMKDEEGIDTKIMAVPMEKVDPEYKDTKDIMSLSEHTMSMITHFFMYYKSLEPGKWVELSGWKGAKEAEEYILSAIGKEKARRA